MRKYRLFGLVLTGSLVWLTQPSFGATVEEDFSNDPAGRGWQCVGNTNLFRWDSTNHLMAVTWDSRQPNSYLYHSLPWYLTRFDDFTFEFDLRLDDLATGIEPGKTTPLQVALGFLELSRATNSAFLRGMGMVTNIAEFNYYTEGSFEWGGITFDSPACVVPSFVSDGASPHFAPASLSAYNFALPTNEPMHVRLSYTAATQTALLEVTTNGTLVGPLPPLVLNAANNFDSGTDFRVDVFSISSYTGIGDDYNSLLGHGWVGNVKVTLASPVQNVLAGFSNGVWQVTLTDRTNWLYALERTVDFNTWTTVAAPVAGTGTGLALQDPNPPATRGFYRVRAQRP